MNFKFTNKIEEAKPEEVNKQQEEIRKLQLPKINTQEYVYVNDSVAEIQYEYVELTAVCPMTGIQDTYTVRVKYIPKDNIPELKSLRFYFLAYRDIPIFHEHLINKIFEDFGNAVKPSTLTVELDVALRGGIHTTLKKQVLYGVWKDNIKSIKEFV
jgi:7-cyano-7-deazaguanine reductase